MQDHCARQDAYTKRVIGDGKDFPNHYSFEPSSLPDGNDRVVGQAVNFRDVKFSYKSTEFQEMNGFLFFRARPDDYFNSRTKKFGRAAYPATPNQVQYLQSETYILLAGILDLPRLPISFHTYRILGRQQSASGLSENDFIDTYRIGNVQTNYMFVSSGLVLGGPEDVDGSILMKIKVPAYFPAMFFFADCGSGSLENSEVVLPYTTSLRNELTFGYQVVEVERDVVEQGFKVKALITVEIVMLDKPVQIEGGGGLELFRDAWARDFGLDSDEKKMDEIMSQLTERFIDVSQVDEFGSMVQAMVNGVMVPPTNKNGQVRAGHIMKALKTYDPTLPSTTYASLKVAFLKVWTFISSSGS